MPEIQVLEIGSGNGRMVPGVVAQAHGVRNTGSDTSRAIVREAEQFNAELVVSGTSAFFLLQTARTCSRQRRLAAASARHPRGHRESAASSCAESPNH